MDYPSQIFRRALISVSTILALLAVAIPPSAQAQETSAAMAGLKGPAAAAASRYLETEKIDCPTAEKVDNKCTVAPYATGGSLFYGKMPGDPAQYAIAFVTYEPPTGGNAVHQMAVVFKSGADGTYVPVGRVENVVGLNPRDVRFGRGAISYTGTVLGPGEPRCCPTASKSFTLRVANGSVSVVDGSKSSDPANDATASTPARSKAAAYLIREQIAEACGGKKGTIDPASVIERDLTGDNRADLIISHEGIACTDGGRSSFCGAQVCSVMIYVRRGALLKLEVDDLLGMKVTVGNGRRPPIRMLAHGGAARTIRWNGRGFR